MQEREQRFLSRSEGLLSSSQRRQISRACRGLEEPSFQSRDGLVIHSGPGSRPPPETLREPAWGVGVVAPGSRTAPHAPGWSVRWAPPPARVSPHYVAETLKEYFCSQGCSVGPTRGRRWYRHDGLGRGALGRDLKAGRGRAPSWLSFQTLVCLLWCSWKLLILTLRKQVGV